MLTPTDTDDKISYLLKKHPVLTQGTIIDVLYKADDFEWDPEATLLAATQPISSKVSAANITWILQ